MHINRISLQNKMPNNKHIASRRKNQSKDI